MSTPFKKENGYVLNQIFEALYECKTCHKVSLPNWGDETKKICKECIVQHTEIYLKTFKNKEVCFGDYLDGVIIAEHLIK